MPDNFKTLSLIFAVLLLLFSGFSIFVALKERLTVSGKWYFSWAALLSYLALLIASLIFTFQNRSGQMDSGMVMTVIKVISGLLTAGYGIFATFHKFDSPVAVDGETPVAWDKWIGISFALTIAFIGVGSEIIAYDVQNRGARDMNNQLATLGVANETTRSQIISVINYRMNTEMLKYQEELEREKQTRITEMDREQQEHAAELVAIRNDQDRERQSHIAELAAVRDDQDKDRQAHTAELAAVRLDQDKERQTHTAELAAVRADLDKERQTHAAELAAVRTDLDRERQAHTSEVTAARSDLDREKLSHANELAAVRNDFDHERQTRLSELTSAKVDLERERQNCKNSLTQYRTVLEKEKQLHTSDISRLRAERQGILETIRAELVNLRNEITARKTN